MHIRRDRVIHHDPGIGQSPYAIAAFGFFASLALAAASALLTAFRSCSTVGGLTLKVSVSTASGYRVRIAPCWCPAADPGWRNSGRDVAVDGGIVVDPSWPSPLGTHQPQGLQ